MYLLVHPGFLVHNFLPIFNRLLAQTTTRTWRGTYISHPHLRRRQLWCWYISIFGWQRAERWIILDGFSKQATSQNPDFGPQLNCGIQLSKNSRSNGSHAHLKQSNTRQTATIQENLLTITGVFNYRKLSRKDSDPGVHIASYTVLGLVWLDTKCAQLIEFWPMIWTAALYNSFSANKRQFLGSSTLS